jgi:ribonuclease HI
MNIVTIYTDGACIPNPGVGGWSAILLSEGSGKYLELQGSESTKTTNNRMELSAILFGLKAVKSPQDTYVLVRTDSQYAIGAAEKPLREDLANPDLIQQIKNELKKFKIWKFEWVRGHSGNNLNERADVLSYEAINKRIDFRKVYRMREA